MESHIKPIIKQENLDGQGQDKVCLLVTAPLKWQKIQRSVWGFENLERNTSSTPEDEQFLLIRKRCWTTIRSNG